MSQPRAGGDAAPGTMGAVVVTRPGGLDVLEIQFAGGVPGGRLRVRMEQPSNSA